jgi:uncharacterized membrane protein YuzA (DUF378 family)
VTNRPVPSPLHLAATREVFREAAEGLPQIIAALQDPNSPNGERMSLLSKSDIFGADDRRTEDVHVPEWGGTVRLRGLSGAERDAYEASLQKQVNGKPVQDLRNFRARLVALSAINEEGLPLFEQNEVAALAGRSSAALSRLFDVACRLSGITDDDVKDLEGNSEPAQSGPSTSASPSPSVALSPNSWHASAPTS